MALSYGHRAGRYAGKALKYHAAEFSTTKHSLLDYLDNYTTKQQAADAQLMDYVITQEEV